MAEPNYMAYAAYMGARNPVADSLNAIGDTFTQGAKIDLERQQAARRDALVNMEAQRTQMALDADKLKYEDMLKERAYKDGLQAYMQKAQGATMPNGAYQRQLDAYTPEALAYAQMSPSAQAFGNAEAGPGSAYAAGKAQFAQANAPSVPQEVAAPFDPVVAQIQFAMQSGDPAKMQQAQDFATKRSEEVGKMSGNPAAGVAEFNRLTGANIQYIGTSKDGIHIKAGEQYYIKRPDGSIELAVDNSKTDPEVLLDKRNQFSQEQQARQFEQQQALERQRQDAKDRREERRGVATGGSGGSGKPPAGYRFTPNGDLEPIPGGAAAQKASDREQGQENSKAAIDLSISTIEKLKNHPGRQLATGKSRVLGAQLIPGTDAYGFDQELKSFDAQLFLSNISSMKGMGALSNAEGMKVSAAAGAIKPGMKESAFLANITDIQNTLKKAKQRYDTGKLVNPDGSPKTSGARPPSGRKTTADPMGIL